MVLLSVWLYGVASSYLFNRIKPSLFPPDMKAMWVCRGLVVTLGLLLSLSVLVGSLSLLPVRAATLEVNSLMTRHWGL